MQMCNEYSQYWILHSAAMASFWREKVSEVEEERDNGEEGSPGLCMFLHRSGKCKSGLSKLLPAFD